MSSCSQWWNHRKGLDLQELKLQAREEARCKQRKEAAALLASFKKTHTEFPHANTSSNSADGASLSNTRKDSSPVKASTFNAVTRLQQY